MFSGINILLIFLIPYLNEGFAFLLKLECDSPIVLGATLNCTTSVFEDDGVTPESGHFNYYWRDNSIPQNSKVTVKKPNQDSWSIEYNRANNSAGSYIIRVRVCIWYAFEHLCGFDNSIGTFFQLTDELNGKISINQGNASRNHFVSTLEPTNSTISLKSSDQQYISQAPTVLSHWFVDCVYYGIEQDLQFDFNFTNPEEDHLIESLVVGDFTPLPPPITVPPPTSSTTPSTTTKSSTTTTTSHSTTTATTTTSAKSKVSKRDTYAIALNTTVAKTDNTTVAQSNIKVWKNGTLVPYNGTFPYVCNSTIVTTDNNKVYGYFAKTVTTKAPINSVSISGNYWLQHGDLLSLDVKCKGSHKMQFCFYFKPGLYNVTGNETCKQYHTLDQCDFPIQRYLQDQHTVVIIIKNDVSIKISSVAVTIYKVNPQAQLSVIVVPVAFSLVAVVTIVFGVAYHLQNRSRFIVEVADFDFGQKYADMEYKTFKDRLKDSIINAFTRDPMPSSSEAPVWPPGHKYGSMT